MEQAYVRFGRTRRRRALRYCPIPRLRAVPPEQMRRDPWDESRRRPMGFPNFNVGYLYRKLLTQIGIETSFSLTPSQIGSIFPYYFCSNPVSFYCLYHFLPLIFFTLIERHAFSLRNREMISMTFKWLFKLVSLNPKSTVLNVLNWM